MNRRTWTFILIGTLVVIAAGVSIYFAFPHPTHLSGDPWDYTILPVEMPKDWTLVSHGVVTPHDVAQQNIETDVPLTEAVSLKNFVQLYYAKYEPPPLSHYLDFTIQIIVYQAEADAQAALAEGAPTEAGWESLTAPTVGDETKAWRFLTDDPTINQNIYRVDFRFLNGVGSVTMIGTRDALPNINEPVSYARKIQNKMLTKATPKEIQRLQALRMPDLRNVLLSQDDLAKLDDYLGGRWQIDARLVPQWTPTDKIQSPQEQKVLQQLGRVSGYQMFLVKVLAAAEKEKSIPAGLFQQVTVYQRPDAAAQSLKLMIGLEKLPELPLPTTIGDQARAWGGVLTTNDTDPPTTVAVHEFDIQVGRYIGSIRLQSRPLAGSELEAGQIANLQMAIKLAEGLAVKMKAANGK
jgi:hypothetical protein